MPDNPPALDKRPAGSPATPQPAKRMVPLLPSSLARTGEIETSTAGGTNDRRIISFPTVPAIPLGYEFKEGRKANKGSLAEALDKTLLQEEATKRARRQVLKAVAIALDGALDDFGEGTLEGMGKLHQGGYPPRPTAVSPGHSPACPQRTEEGRRTRTPGSEGSDWQRTS
ncbi:hypothetical protein M406DRAFT_354870 [Cryphonectria parasitica EP155]|uniref:Uncharacterized protein n=1 Tax=Cryphonectria parasitica (strain ATCC 38755 / EP155) TaxID=660469 RepID=A0A9P5CR70_CRYP1|nr:uncharacterized protein M406DRAFT_354870 [Cryphonectria parasitica EP155]KAF3768244.1 hypothetical protein M406DRAFT_354870 [Cryphonectria parasitica EP155]